MADEAVLRFILQDEADTPGPAGAAVDTPAGGIPRLPAGSAAAPVPPGSAAQATATPPPVELAQSTLDPLLESLYNVEVVVAGLGDQVPPETGPVAAPQATGPQGTASTPATPQQPPAPAPAAQGAQQAVPTAAAPAAAQQAVPPQASPTINPANFQPVVAGGFGTFQQNPPGPTQPAGGGGQNQPKPPKQPKGPDPFEAAAGLARTAGTVAGQAAQGNVLGAAGTAGSAAVTALEGLGGAAIVAGGVIAGLGIAAVGAVAGVQAARSALESLASDVAGYSAAISQAEAQREIQRVQRGIERSQAVGPELADFVQSQAKLEKAIGRISDDLIKEFAPILSQILNVVSATIETLEKANEVRQKLSNFLDKIPIGPGLAKRILKWFDDQDAKDEKGVDIFSLFLNLPDLKIPGFDPENATRLDDGQLGLDLPEGVRLP